MLRDKLSGRTGKEEGQVCSLIATTPSHVLLLACAIKHRLDL